MLISRICFSPCSSGFKQRVLDLFGLHRHEDASYSLLDHCFCLFSFGMAFEGKTVVVTGILTPLSMCSLSGFYLAIVPVGKRLLFQTVYIASSSKYLLRIVSNRGGRSIGKIV